MTVLLRMLVLIGFGVAVSGTFVYGVYRGIQALQRHFGIEEGAKRRLLAEGAPLERARDIANRIRQAIRRSRDSGGELAEDFERDITDLLEQRLPHILDNRRRLDEHLDRLDPQAIRAETEDYRIRLRSCKDDGLKAVLEKNLKLAGEREANLRHLEVLKDKTEAQIKLVILGLQNLEDKVVSLRLVEGKTSSVSGALDNVRGEVDLLEQEYRKMGVSYDD